MTQKDKRKKKAVPYNLYLFLNLIFTGILLISLWQKQPVWNLTISFPNLLLVLVIINTAMILLGASNKGAAGDKKAKSAKKAKISFKRLGAVLKSRAAAGDELLKDVLMVLQEGSLAQAVSLHVFDNARCSLLACAGEMPTALSGSRLTLNKNVLSIHFPGTLGEEAIGDMNALALRFSSASTKLSLAALPLHAAGIEAVCLFSSKEEKLKIKFPAAYLAMYLEALLMLNKTSKEVSEPRFSDKEAKLLSNSAFADSFEVEIERSERYKQEMSLFCISFGFEKAHSAEAMAQIRHCAAMALKMSLRKFDLMFAGQKDNELLAIVTETGVKASSAVAQRVLKAFYKLCGKIDKLDKTELFMYIGAACYPTHATVGSGLLEMSRDALAAALAEKNEFKLYKNQVE